MLRPGIAQTQALLARELSGGDDEAAGLFRQSVTLSRYISRATGDLARLTATPAALELIAVLQREHGPILFHQSGGCCDGSSPMCYPRNEFAVGEADVLLGEIGGAPFHISRPQFEYWKHTQLIIDLVSGRGNQLIGSGWVVDSNSFPCCRRVEFVNRRGAGLRR